MTRDSDAGARVKRRSNPLLDPNRSSMRRVINRRVGPRPTVAPRVSGAPAPRSPSSARPSLLPRLDDPAQPRNRRNPRASKQETGAEALRTRLWLRLFAALSLSVQTVGAQVSALTARVRGRAAEASLSAEQPASVRSTRTMQAVGVCIALLGVWAMSRFVQKHLTTAPAFAVDAVDVKGLSRVDKAELMQAAGLELGLNVFARSPEDIRARLLRHPWILSARVERKLPSRFEIAIEERAPVALLVVEACSGGPSKNEDDPACDEASSLYLVSDDAKLFKRLSGKDPVDLPVITGVARQRFASDPDLQRRILVDAVALMHEYKNSGLWQRNPLGEIHIEPNDGYSLYVGEDLTYVRLGAKPFEQKLLRMKKVFERLEREHARAEYVYLDNEQRPDRVAVRLR